MRRTVHLICAEDAGWLLPLFSGAIVRWSRKRLADFGLDRRAQDRALRVLHDAVDADGALTRPELAERLERAGFETANEFKVHLWLLATLDGELCLGPDRGRQTCLVRTVDWLGTLEPRPRDDSLAELARRYLRAYGPATERDLARWAGLPLRDARLGFERIVSELRAAGERSTLGAVTSGRPLARGPPPRRVRQLQPRLRRSRRRDRRRARAARQPRRRHRATVDHRRRALRRHLVVEAQRRAARGRRSSRSGGSPPDVERAIEAEVADLGRFEGLDATIAGEA